MRELNKEMKGYYITYGIFSECIEDTIMALSKALSINIIEGSQGEADELYHLEEKACNPHRIKYFSIYRANCSGYYINSSCIEYPNYLIACNIILEEENDIYLDSIREMICGIKHIKELNVEKDEW